MLELAGLSKDFGKLRAVDDISLGLERGEIRGLIGPNGSGKTTIFNLISGFLRPTSGQVIWREENIAGKPPHVIARKGVVRTFQLTSIYTELTALENVVMACHLRTGMGVFEQFIGSNKAQNKEKALEERALTLLELMTHFFRRTFGDLFAKIDDRNLVTGIHDGFHVVLNNKDRDASVS